MVIDSYMRAYEETRQEIEEIPEDEEELCFFYEGDDVDTMVDWVEKAGITKFTLYQLPDDTIVVRFYSKKDAATFKFYHV